MMLREGTRKAHRMVERMAFVRAFLRGVMDSASYGRLLIDLHYIYSQLEENLQHQAENPLLAPLILPPLWRTPALARDLIFFAIPNSATPSSAARRYGTRLAALAVQRPELLIAHAYTRYLGDLSGGQILRAVAARALHLTGDNGLSFYDFPQITDLQRFKKEYRTRLDHLPISGALAEEIVAEAVTAFALNGEVFAELSGNALRSLRKLVISSGAFKPRLP